MCGIFGVLTGEGNSYANRRKEAFYKGMLFNFPRGRDAAGVACVRELEKGKTNVSIHKRGIEVTDFLASAPFNRLMNDFERYHYVIGHTRASTLGAHNHMNAHPFNFKHITLVHNGTVAQDNLDVKVEETVDSAKIAAYMAEHGEIETLERLNGGFSLVWYNQDDDTVNFARNKRKPMAFAFEEDKNTMFFSSEWSVALCATDTSEIVIEKTVLIPAPFVHYKFSKEDLRAYTKTEFKEYERPFVGSNHHGWTGQENRERAITHQPTRTSDTDSEHGTGGDCTTRTVDTQTPTGNSGEEIEQGVSSSSDRLEYVTKKLKGYGFQSGVGQLIRAKGRAFIPLKNQLEMGHVEIQFPSHPHHIGIVFGMKKADWNDIYMKHSDVPVRMVNIKANYAGRREAIVCVVDREWLHFCHNKELHKRSPETLQAKAAEQGKKELPKKDDYVPGPLDGVTGTDGHPISDPLFDGPNGGLVTRERWIQLTRVNCGGCDGPINIDHHRHVHWMGETPVCHECTGNPAVLVSLGIEEKTIQKMLMH